MMSQSMELPLGHSTSLRRQSIKSFTKSILQDASRSVTLPMKTITRTGRRLSQMHPMMLSPGSSVSVTSPDVETHDEPEEDDCAALVGTKPDSIVNMLTTASIYAGLEGDVLVGNIPGFEVVEDEDLGEEADLSIETIPSIGTDSDGKDDDERVSTFEISIKENFETSATNCAEKISSKLISAFELSPSDIFIKNFVAWLMKDVLLQGNLYLTKENILFLAFLPKSYSQNEIVYQGSLAMKAKVGSNRYWAVLRRDTFSIYPDSTTLYFPTLVVDIANMLRVESLVDGGFQIITGEKTYKFQADNVHSARTWVSDLTKTIFKKSNSNEKNEVLIKIPISNVIELEKSTLLNENENETSTVRIKYVDENFGVDELCLMFYRGGGVFSSLLNELVGNEENDTDSDEPEDFTSSRWRKDSFIPKPISEMSNDEFQKLERKVKSSSESFDPVTLGKFNLSPSMKKTVTPKLSNIEEVDPVQTTQIITTAVTSPKLAKLSDSKKIAVEETPKSSWGYNPLNLMKGVLNTGKAIYSVRNMWSADPAHYYETNSLERGTEDPYLITDENERLSANANFHKYFALAEEENLIASYYTYFQKNVPIYGKIYLGENEICFRSLIPGNNTMMILPYEDIETCSKEKGFRFTYYGLVVIIRGHEELFFEFGSAVARDDCELLLLKQLERFNNIDDEDPIGSSTIQLDSMMDKARLKFMEDRINLTAGLDIPIIMEESPFFKTSVKPKRRARFTLLTIGSRGDVQPYIALGKGLIEEGHFVTIATHIEFKSWIESHGLGFKEIAGNPAELMSLMVTHGTMSVAFLKEAKSKFTGWITDLLDTSWEACQETDILIESPSAMAGAHIAEALGIPYFRAFTMPWTRTRAYPHAFIVPDQRRGGSYNYLTHVMFENIFWSGISGQVNSWRVEKLGIPKTNLDKLQQSKIPFLYNISPTVFPPSVDFADWVKVTGYWFLNEGGIYDPPAELIQFMKDAREDGKKIVYIGFGSIVVSDPKSLTQAVIDAVLQSDIRCILNKGWSERLNSNKKNELEVPLPSQIYNSGAIPHDWLFPQIDAAVHHGGSGTTGATLRFGLPTIIKPFFGDQFFYANRVEDIGAGVGLKKLNASSLAKAIKKVTTDTRVIEKAKAIGEKIRSENGVMKAIESIYSELEYARSLSLGKQKTNKLSDNLSEEETDEDDEMSFFMI